MILRTFGTKKRLVLTILTACALGMLMGGCGKNVQVSDLQAARDAVTNLEYETALASYEKALEGGADPREIYREEGIAYLGLADYEHAVEYLEKSLSLSSFLVDELDVDVNFYLATACEKMGNPAKAEEIYSAIIRLEPKNAEAYYQRAIVRLEQNSFSTAKADFDQSLSLTPGNYDRLIDMVEILEEYGYEDEGYIYLQTALTQGAKDLTDYDRGRIYFCLGEFETARTYLENARDAKVDGATYYLGKSWEALGEYNYAASVYQTYLQEKGESALIYNELAICELQLGEYNAAREAVERGLALGDATMARTLQFNRIVIYEYQSDFATAKELVAAYLKAYPDDEDAKREAEFLKTRS